MTKSTNTNLNKKLKKFEKDLNNLTAPEIQKYKSDHPSVFENLGFFSEYAKIDEYRSLINKLSALLKENCGNKHIAELLIGMIEKYSKILEAKSSAALAVANFNHIISANLMSYIQKLQSGNFEKYLNAHRGVLTAGMIVIAERMVEYMEIAGWHCVFQNEDFEFSDDAPLYNKMLNIILENNYFADIQEYFPDYNHDCAWKEILKNLEWISEESQFWCNKKKISEQEQE